MSYDKILGGKNGVLTRRPGGSFMVCSLFRPLKRNRFLESNEEFRLDLNMLCSSQDMISEIKSQDADYSHVPSLCEDVEALILARVPRSEHWKFCLVNKEFYSLWKSGELYRIRREIGFKEPSVFILPIGESSWWTFDPQLKSSRTLPEMPSDYTFKYGDKESLCAGTHLLVSGKEDHGAAIWRYELLTNKWFKGPAMINPRSMFASANCGVFAFVAGGISMVSNNETLNSAEKYDSGSKSWLPLPPMHIRRQRCSGCYMDGKFYVIGGINEEGINLTCGEALDEKSKTWELIPDMIKDIPVLTSQSPPLIAVVNNELYSIEASSNELKLYLKGRNSWRMLGKMPVRADSSRGWGVAFKSIGNELLVMGAPINPQMNDGMVIFTCCPDPTAEKVLWKPLEYGEARRGIFILNCSVMLI